MGTTDLEKRLRSIGKEILVEYFEDFRTRKLDSNELALKLLNANPKANSLAAQKTRISNAKKIFDLNLEKEVLNNIIQSDRVPVGIQAKAKIILNALSAKV